jgi:tryptophan synthase alpha chain
VATVLLFAPSTPPDRVDRLAAATQGFAYASARMAVTGKSVGGGDGERVVESIRRTSDVPALIGIGIASADQARDAARVSDGVIVGSALVQVVLDGGGPSEVEAFIREFRHALDD